MKSSVLDLGGPEFPAIASDGTVTIADSGLMLSGIYSRDGDDLVVTGQDGQQLQIVEYFSQGTPPALISTDGKMLSGDTVALLAGPQAPGQYAQTTGGQFGDAIGQVETLEGTASAQRPNGLTVELEVGSQVFQGDVVSAGANSTLGITFVDKTVFSIEDGATMVLNEMVYNASSSSNSMLFNLIDGTAAFIAGAVAKSGDMKVETPVAVMAIRGTQPGVICNPDKSCVFGGAEGKYDLLHKVLGQVLATVEDPSQVVLLSSVNATPTVSAPSAAQQAAFGKLFQSLRKAIDLLDERLEEGEDPVREAGTGSPDFADAGFLPSIGGFFTRAVTTLLGKESLQQTVAEEPEETPMMIEPPLVASTDEDTGTIIEIITEDDVLGVGASARVVGAVVTSGLGTARPSDDGKSVIYDPGAEYNHLSVGDSESVQVSVQIDLGNGTIRTEPVFVTVVGVNDMPTASPDAAATDEGAAVSINVLGNDTDPDANDDLEVAQANITDGLGAVSVSGDGKSIIYDPAGAYDHLAAGETADVVINYQLSDGQGGFASSTATVTIHGVNSAPVLTVDPAGDVQEDVDVAAGKLSDSGALSFTDVDTADTHIVTTSFNDDATWTGGPLSAAKITAISSGFTADTSGWAYDVSNSAVQFLAAGETITLSFDVTVIDNSGATDNSDTETVAVTITGTNDRPVLTVDATGEVTENIDVAGGSLSDSGALSFADVDNTDTHIVNSSYNGDAVWSGGPLSATAITSISGGFTADASGWAYDVSNAALQFLAAGETITLSFNVTVTDQSGAGNNFDTETVTVTITGRNDRPVLTVDANGGVQENIGVADGKLSDSGALSFTDVDTTDTHVVTTSYNGDASWSGGTLAAGVITSVSTGFAADATGWTYDVSNAALQFLAAGETITLSFDVTVIDDSGTGNNADTETVTITITGSNDTPDLTVDTTGAVVEDVAVSDGQLSDSGALSFTDLDTSDIEVISSTYNGDASWSGGTLSAAKIAAISTGFAADATGWTYDVSNAAVQFLAAGETITLSFDVTVMDNSGAGNNSDTETVTVTITGRNDTPVLTVDAAGSVEENIGVAGGMLSDSGGLSFTDVDTTDTHVVAASYNGDASWSGGELSVADINSISTGFDADASGWTYDVSNAALQFLAAGETITLSFDVTVIDSSGAGNNADTEIVTVTITGRNDKPVLTVEATGGVIEDNGVSDGMLSDSGALSFTDVDTTDTHVVTSSYNGDASWSDGTLSAAQINAVSSGFDADDSGWTYDVSNAALQFLAVGERITVSFDVTVTDDSGTSNDSDTETVTITIIGRNDTPVLTVDATGSVEENIGVSGGKLSDSGALSFTDVDTTDTHVVTTSYNGDASWSDGILPANVITSVSTGFAADASGWAYDVSNAAVQFLAAGETITLSFDVTVIDNSGAGNNADTETVTVTITGRNDKPVLTVDVAGGVIEDNGVSDGLLSDSGALSFTDVDMTDAHVVTSSYNGDASWSDGTLPASVITAVSTGFAADASGWTYDVSNAALQFLAVGERITLSFDVTVTDDSGTSNDSDTETVTITIIGRNDRPDLIVDATGSVSEDIGVSDGKLSDSGALSFTDVDTTDTHVVSSSYNGDATWSAGTLSAAKIAAISTGFAADATGWTYDVANSALQFLAAGETIVLSFDVTVTDDSTAGTDSDTETVTLTITGRNDAPLITAANNSGDVDELPDGAIGENTRELTVSDTIMFKDVDASDMHTVSVSAIGPAPRGALTASVTGTTVTWTYTVIGGELDDLADGDSVIQSYLVTIDDGNGGTDSQIVDITLTGTNDVAIITGTTTGTVIEDDEIETIAGLLDVVDPDIRQDGTVEAAFTAAVIIGTYGTLTIGAGGAWSYTLDNDADTTNGLVTGDSVTDSFTVSTIDGTTQAINVTVEGVGFDFEFADFGGNSGSSQFKSLDAGDIESIDIDLLITPMPLTIISAGKEVANKVNATQSDLGVGAGQDVASDEGLRFEFLSQSVAMNQNDIAALAYVSHIALVLFQAELSSVQGNQASTASIQLRIVNADDDNNFDTLNDAGDVVVPLSAGDVTVMIAPGNAGNYQILQLGDTVAITGLQEGDNFTINSPTAFNRVEVENASDIYGGENFEVGVLGFNMPQELMLVGDGTSAPLIGADSNDTLNSGAGQQELTGGKGVDVFMFDGSASTGALADIIIDYEANIDVVDLTGLFDVAPGAFTEAAVEEYARYLSGNDNDGSSDPSGSTGDLFVDADGAANGENFVLLAHSNTMTDYLIVKVDDGTDIGYVTIV